jgi:hypothetical protein
MRFASRQGDAVATSRAVPTVTLLQPRLPTVIAADIRTASDDMPRLMKNGWRRVEECNERGVSSNQSAGGSTVTTLITTIANDRNA